MTFLRAKNDIHTERNIRLHKQRVLSGKTEVVKKREKQLASPLIVPIYPYPLPVPAAYRRNARMRRANGSPFLPPIPDTPAYVCR